jgi:hypothetical protein
VAVIIVIAMAGVGVGIAASLVKHVAAGSASSLSGGFPTAQLSTLTMKQTPESMAKITGVKAEPTMPGSGSIDLTVPLSGGPYDRLRVEWDASDPTHAKEAYLYASNPVPGDATIRQKLGTLLGRRFDSKGNFNFGWTFLAYDATTASAHVELSMGSDKNAHWKDGMDAAWDVLRAGVLGQNVTVSDAEQRDWLGRGYTLTAVGGVDPATDVDHSTAVMTAAFPGVAMRKTLGIDHTIAIDHPWYGEAELDWPDKAKVGLSEVMIRPPPGAQSFSNQHDIDACVTAAFGQPKTKGTPDHLSGDYDTTWTPPGGGEIRVYHHMVSLRVGDNPFGKAMPKGTWVEAMRALDLCGRRK